MTASSEAQRKHFTTGQRWEKWQLPHATGKAFPFRADEAELAMGKAFETKKQKAGLIERVLLFLLNEC